VLTELREITERLHALEPGWKRVQLEHRQGAENLREVSKSVRYWFRVRSSESVNCVGRGSLGSGV
jgi:hypothetical protein